MLAGGGRWGRGHLPGSPGRCSIRRRSTLFVDGLRVGGALALSAELDRGLFHLRAVYQSQTDFQLARDGFRGVRARVALFVVLTLGVRPWVVLMCMFSTGCVIGSSNRCRFRGIWPALGVCYWGILAKSARMAGRLWLGAVGAIGRRLPLTAPGEASFVPHMGVGRSS